MTTVTAEEIAQFRTELAAYPKILKSLDAIEDCEGDLEDAALGLAIEIGQLPDRSDWLDGFAKRCRPAICQKELKENLLNGKLAAVVESLIQSRVCPQLLIAPVLMYVMKQGLDAFCEPLSFKL